MDLLLPSVLPSQILVLFFFSMHFHLLPLLSTFQRFSDELKNHLPVAFISPSRASKPFPFSFISCFLHCMGIIYLFTYFLSGASINLVSSG